MTKFLIPLFILYFVSFNARAEQNYSGNSALNCSINDKNGPSSAFLYTCNGLSKSCLAFLMFKSQPPYNTVTSISNLTSSDSEKLATINDASMFTVFPTGKEVIVPVNCSCKTTDYYQADTNYTLSTTQTYFVIANDTYEGLATCGSLLHYNPYGALDLHAGMQLHVPLRCACPTRSQIASGIKYLLTYPVDWGDNVSSLATRFKVSSSSVLDANTITTPTLYPFTTILIPLPSEPESSTTIVHPGRPPTFSPPVSPNKKTKSKRKLYVAVAATGGFVLVVCVVLFSVFLLRKRSATFVEGGQIRKTKFKSSEEIRDEIASIEHVSKEYKFQEIKEATENFSSKNRIGGSVYRGLFGQDILAVKKMSTDASKEVNMLKKINHFNVIKLQGYCKNEGFFYLVFEYMENGSLREWLGKNVPMGHQSWAKRIQIALDIANGLQYLHDFTEPCYVHKDINTSNILLNKDARAKIANFRLARESEGDITLTCSSQAVGTRGHMAPEYLEAGLVSPKMDVYAFGVVLLELITGKDSIIVQARSEVMLSTVIGSVVAKDDAEADLSSFIDPSLRGSSGKACVIELAEISVACLVQEPARRPSMADIVSSLLRIQTNVPPRISPTINSNSPRMGR
ncbi:lysM domain receptor-like kinase 4 [Neltuma alba]|uniref:lysM domain receptor-like kinase 4 n=1 Tax=Neltuma alba TaxID=207710 RepID=UPI0010A36C7F|nr:lysM domain receptor-like kinase 4 [Prosopis alba]